MEKKTKMFSGIVLLVSTVYLLVIVGVILLHRRKGIRRTMCQTLFLYLWPVASILFIFVAIGSFEEASDNRRDRILAEKGYIGYERD